MTPIQKYNSLTGYKALQAMRLRNIESHYCQTREEALEKCLSFIGSGSSVAWGGSQTLNEIGLLDKLRGGGYDIADRDNAATPEEKRACELAAFSADVYFMSSNAIALNGTLVNIDGYGNRVAALIYGPKNVVVVAGVNKLAATEQAAMERARSYAAPINAIRLKLNNPCVSTGICHNCTEDQCICRNIVVTRMSAGQSRIKVVLVGETLGF